MKKSILMLLCLFSSFFGSAQFTTPSYLETIYPTAAMDVVLRPQHTSCYEMDGVMTFGPPNNLYLYSWNTQGAPSPLAPKSGFAWKRTGPGGSSPVYDFNYQLISPPIFDLEVGFVNMGGRTYIVTVFYEVGVGHKYVIYTWNPTSVTVFSSGVLSSSTTYGRISLDVHRLYGVAITWEVGGRIYVKTMDTTPGYFDIGATREIAGITNGAIPDIAFAHVSDLLVRISYVHKVTGDIHTINRPFTSVMTGAGSLPFATDDVHSAAFPSTVSSSPLLSNNLQLDCPDHHSEDNWSFIYSDDAVTVNARIKTGAPPPFAVTLSTAPISTAGNGYLTLAYAPGGTSIHYGWFTNFVFTPTPGYISRELSETGVVLSPTWPNFNRIANSGLYSSAPALSFSKQNDWSSALFAVYAMHGTGGSGYEMRYKTVPWTAGSFRPGDATSIEDLQNDGAVTISPNPFTNNIAINIAGDNGNANYRSSITDVQGRVLFVAKGTLQNINQQLAEWSSHSAQAGLYFIQLQEANGKVHRSFKIVKQ